MSEYLSGKTLSEKQMFYYNGLKCPYCDAYTDLINSKEIYGEDYGLMYICRPCKAHVGVHSGTDQALGALAKKTLRELRHEAHKWFDPLWRKRMQISNLSVKSARAKAYRWMSELLEIDPVEAHIGFLNDKQCKILIDECKKYYNK